MSALTNIEARGRTRRKLDQIAAVIAESEDIAELIAAEKIAVQVLSSTTKGTLDERLSAQVAKLGKVLITVAPVAAKNSNAGTGSVRNVTNVAINQWTRPSWERDGVPAPLDLIDEVQRVLHGVVTSYPSGAAGHPNDRVTVAAWVEVPDPVYLNHEIQLTVPIQLAQSES